MISGTGVFDTQLEFCAFARFEHRQPAFLLFKQKQGDWKCIARESARVSPRYTSPGSGDLDKIERYG